MSTSFATPLQGPVSMTVPFAATSVATARRALEGWLSHQGYDERVVDDARLIISELVGNAVRHARPLANDELLVRWHLDGSDLILVVCDGGGESAPSRVVSGPDAVAGRGLAIVEALSGAWWVERHRDVHSVHARVPLG